MTTYTTYSQVGVREDLSDAIYNIAPTDTPYLTMVQKGKPAKNRKIEWQTDTLRAASGDNALKEGADAVFTTARPTVRVANHTQILGDAIIVSETANAVDTAGREEELAYQLTLTSKEVKRDLEVRLTGNYASVAGTAATVRKLAGFEAWIKTNDSRGTGGTAPGYQTSTQLVTAATDATSTNLRTFTETRLKTGIRNAWTAGGQPSILMVGPYNKGVASGFAGIATKYNVVNKEVGSNAIIGAADLYASDFGVFKIVANRFSRDRSALGIQPDKISLHYLRPWQTKPLAKTGDAEKRQILCEVSQAMRNEAAHFIIADLITA